MSTRRRGFAGLFRSSNDNQPQPIPSPPASPRPGRVPDMPPMEERIMTSEELQQSVEALEMVLKSMDSVRDQTNRYNAALRDHARSLRGYAVGINMVATRDERGQRVNVGDNRVSERLLVHCANYYDRLAESQEQLARTYLEEYNILNNYAAKHFKTLARDSAKLDGTLKELTRKLSKLTHKTTVPGTATTQNASTVQNPGVHEIYVQKLTGLSGQIQRVRQDHLAVYSRQQKNVDRHVGRTFARCTRENYDFLGNALLKTGTSEAIGGVNAWGVYANANISPPINELDGEADGEGEVGDEWEPSQEDGDELMSPRQIAQSQGPRPPSAFTDFSSLIPGTDNRGSRGHPNMSLNMQGKLPSHASQTGFQAYPGPSQQSQQPLQTQQSQQYLSQPSNVLSPVPTRTGQGSLAAHQQYAPINEGTNGLGMTQGVPGGSSQSISRFQERFSPSPEA